jgi:hypothetical protein
MNGTYGKVRANGAWELVTSLLLHLFTRDAPDPYEPSGTIFSGFQPLQLR